MSRAQFLISVIVPCFNHGRYLAEALNSIARQTYANWECLIVNDGSSDDTSEVAAHFVGLDPRYRYFHQSNRGLAASRNRGLSLARGDHVQFLDADDILLEEKLEFQVAALGKLDCLTVVHCDYSRGRVDCIREAGTPRLPADFVYQKPLYDLALRWETDLSIPIHCFLFDARLFRNHGIRFDDAKRAPTAWDETSSSALAAMAYVRR